MDSGGEPSTDRRGGLRIGRCLTALVTAVYLWSAGGSLTTTDAVVAFEVTRQLVDHQTVALPGDMLGNEAHRGRDGRYYSPFGIAQSVFNLPFFLAARGLERAASVTIGRSDSLEKAAVALGNAFAMAACLSMLYLFAWRASRSIHAAAAVTLVAAFATPLWPYSKFGFNAPLGALSLTGAAYAAWNATRGVPRAHPMWIGCWLGLALLTRHELPIVIVPIGLWLYLEATELSSFGRSVVGVALGLLPAIVGWLSYNAWRFGNPFDAGYLRDATPQFGSSLAGGLYGLLFSSTASLVAYCPLVMASALAFAAIWRADRRLVVLLGGCVLVLLLFYAQLGNWMGGRSYGPRYLVPALPLMMLPLAFVCPEPRSGRRAAFVLLVFLSTIVQAPAVLVDYAKVSVSHARAEGPLTLHDRLYNWRLSPLALNAGAAVDVVPRNIAWLTGRIARPSPVRGSDPNRASGEFSQQFADSLDLWWMYLFRMGVISAEATWTLIALMLITIAGLAFRLAQLLRACPSPAVPSRATR
jgi:hypothetical protein